MIQFCFNSVSPADFKEDKIKRLFRYYITDDVLVSVFHAGEIGSCVLVRIPITSVVLGSALDAIAQTIEDEVGSSIYWSLKIKQD